MIQPAAPSAASALASLSGLPAENGAPGQQNGTFAEVLAGQPAVAETAAPVPTVEGDMLPMTKADMALAAAQPNVAGLLPLTGKILPGLLPVGEVTPAEPVPVEPDLSAQTPPAEAIPTLLSALRALAMPLQPATATKTSASLALHDTVTAENGTDEPSADPVQPFGLAALANLVPAASMPSAETAAASASTLPPMIAAQLLGQPLRDVTAMMPPPGTATEAAKSADLALKVDPARVDAGATGALVFEAPSARPTSGVKLRPVLATELDATLAPDATSGTDAAGLLANPSASSAPLAATAAPAMVHNARPHDFAALMDRLITARDAAQTGLPQSVQVAVNHAEFGQISLNFQHDQAGLAVSVASADPDFARAVQAAVPPAGAAVSADGAGRDNGQSPAGRGDAAAAGGNPGQRQQRGSNPSDSDKPLANVIGRSAEARDVSGARPRGIFA